ncbi:MAG: RNA-binding S4 domain-containing protein [Tannerella sp.]|jgi:ribosome-associated heat shock protein Hsp15|nr:RNA-binding S4 domain-containing protein [Tannerella sp.]
MNEVRIDKWMWATRIFKTRTIASDACKKNRVSVGGVTVKPSRMVKTGDVVSVRKPPVTYSFRVLDITEKRMGAKSVPQYLENITPPEQYEVLKMNKISGFIDRAKGLGRPTKKDRRELEQFADVGQGLSGGDMASGFDWDETWLGESEDQKEPEGAEDPEKSFW